MRARRPDIDLDLGELPQLPRDWKWGRLEDVASDERNAIVDGPFGSNLKLSDYIEPPGVPVLTTANLRGDYSPGSVRYISQAKFEELRRSEVRGGDILVAKIGSCGLTGVYPEEMPSAIIPANLLKMTVRAGTSKGFVLHYLNSPTFSRFLKAIITATAQPAFNVSKFRQLPIPLAPKPAQFEIVDEIEKQLTRLDAGVAALRRVQANLKRYRAAVLKAACEGRLVRTEAEIARKERRTFETGAQLLTRILEERRRAWLGRGNCWEPGTSEVVTQPELPAGWSYSQLGSLLSHIEAGKSFRCEERPPRDGELGVAKVSAVTWGRYNEDESKTCLQPNREDGSLLIREGDFLFSRANTLELVGACVIAGRPSRKVMLSDKTLRFRFAVGAQAPWVLWYLRSKQGRSEIERLSTGNQLSMRNIGQERIRQIGIPIPPAAEQTRIVAEVERRLSVIDEMEATVAVNYQRATRLRQSVLQAAFSPAQNEVA